MLCQTESIIYGSSPRMRGTLLAKLIAPDSKRFIPAYAGNTSIVRACPIPVPVHPRVCGEHTKAIPGVVLRVGSSPRMRGTLESKQLLKLFHRFIPAYAGNTLTSKAVDDTVPVHPRVCGEHTPPCPNIAGHIGSSPRMRGTHQRLASAVSCKRFIPAYAGNTIVVSYK